MSRSNPTVKNPATRFMQWRGGEEGGGRITYYDKETQEEIEVPLPFSFLVLDELQTLTGFNDAQQSGYWSNEVRNSNGLLVARTKQGIQARGTYQQIKEMGLNGLKFAQSVYVMFKDETGEFQIGNFKFSGAAMSAWIDFKKQFDIDKCAVYITNEPKKAKKGRNTYFIPVFEGQNVTDATEAEAQRLDEQLQRYLNTYMQRKPDEDDNGATAEDDGPKYATTTDELNGKPKPSKDVKPEDVQIENLDEKADDDDTEDGDGDSAAKAETKPQKDAKKLKPMKDVAF